jgi:hypothetical protein
VDGAERDMQHLIMLGVLTAQSADKPAPFAPRDPHRFHVATTLYLGDLRPEESPSLTVGLVPVPPPFGFRPRVLAQGRHPFGVGPR